MTEYASPAFHENTIPAIWEIAVQNASDEDLREIVVNIEIRPPAMRPQTLRIDRVQVGANHCIEALDIRLDAALLSSFTEACRLSGGARNTDPGDKAGPGRGSASDQGVGATKRGRAICNFCQPGPVESRFRRAMRVDREPGRGEKRATVHGRPATGSLTRPPRILTPLISVIGSTVAHTTDGPRRVEPGKLHAGSRLPSSQRNIFQETSSIAMLLYYILLEIRSGRRLCTHRPLNIA